MDDADMSDERIQRAVDEKLAAVRKLAAAIPPGKPGDCELCGEWSARLVNGACAPCRDRYKIK